MFAWPEEEISSNRKIEAVRLVGVMGSIGSFGIALIAISFNKNK
jgi:hypothetical protein